MGDTARTGTLSLQQAGGAEHGHLLVIDEHASRIVGIPGQLHARAGNRSES